MLLALHNPSSDQTISSCNLGNIGIRFLQESIMCGLKKKHNISGSPALILSLFCQSIVSVDVICGSATLNRWSTVKHRITDNKFTNDDQ